MEEKNNRAEEKKEWYQYREFPKNVRQIGVPLPGQKVYLEDYVITYLKQQFMHVEEPAVVLLLGTRGEAQAQEAVFVYGAVALQQKNVLTRGALETEGWNRARETACQAFPGARVIGWACGVPMWNSSVDTCVRQLQKKEFHAEGSVLFLWDLSEKEEKLFLWQKGMLQEQSGYYVYFAKNPQMQEFMLGGSEPESTDAAYDDEVTVSMRRVIEEKEERKKNLHLLSWCGAVAAGIVLLFGIHTMLESTQRIQKMEQTVDTLTEYVGKQQDDVETMSREAGQAVAQITFSPTGETARPVQTREQTAKVSEKPVESSFYEGKKVASAEKEKSVKTGTSSAEQTKSVPNSTSAKEAESAEPSFHKAKKTASAARTTQQSYIVRKGDTLSQIVWRQYHDMSYEKKVKKRNGLQSADEIYQGQCLILPKYKK